MWAGTRARRPVDGAAPSDRPLTRPRHERLVLVVTAVAALLFVHPANAQDKTRLALSQAVVEHGELTIDRYGSFMDQARYGDREFTDKAPGLSFLAVPAVAALRIAEPVVGELPDRLWESAPVLWLLRLVVVGPFLLLLVLLLGRTAEGMVPGSGALVALVAGLATLLGPLSSILFAHVPAAALLFAAFLVVRRDGGGLRLLGAGALCGAAVLVDYQSALVVLVLLALVLARRGPRAALTMAAGGVPFAVLLGAYDAVAFGSPLHLSYRYVDSGFAQRQASGFFGIGAPRLDSVAATLVGARGLVLVSPVLLAAVVGLALLWRRGKVAEAATAAAIGVLFLLVEAGYFLPYGGFSPGPRFLAPAVPFLLLGLPLAFRSTPRLVRALAVVSICLTTADAFIWPGYAPDEPFHPTLPSTVFSGAGAPRLVGVAVVLAAVAVALVVVIRSRPGVPEQAAAPV